MKNLIKSEWFKRRKYGGWGITPTAWQWWVVVAAIIAPVVALSPQVAASVKSGVFVTAATMSLAAYMLFLAAFELALMINIKVDERELLHEAVAERNGFWVMAMTLTVGIAAEAISPDWLHGVFPINIFILAAFALSFIAKVATSHYLDRTN